MTNPKYYKPCTEYEQCKRASDLIQDMSVQYEDYGWRVFQSIYTWRDQARNIEHPSNILSGHIKHLIKHSKEWL